MKDEMLDNEIATQMDEATIKTVSEKFGQLAQEAEKNGLPWCMGLFNPEILKIVKANQANPND